ncbi:MAG: hypothetical protein JWN32_1914 [Solirubrobacterales bacterium]|nr:hypothetical protein [Solirubrobacterales bacterium]
MADIVKQYTSEIRKALGYLAAWTPGTGLRLGDIGVMRNRAFIPQSSVRSFNIDFRVRHDGSPIDFDYSSRGVVSIAAHAGASAEDPTGAISKAKGSVKVKFEREHATVFSCLGCVQHQVEDVLSLQEEVWGRYQAGLWREEWIVVTHLMVADSATILISDTKGAEIDFQASGDLQASGIRLGDASLGLAATSVKEVSNRWVAAHRLTPMFLAIGIGRGLLGSPHVGPLRRSAELTDSAPAPPELNERFAYYDYPEE